MQNRTSVWFFPSLCDQYCIQTMRTQVIKLNFCVSIFLALVITELPLIPSYFNNFFPFVLLFFTPLYLDISFLFRLHLFIVFISFFHPFFFSFFFSSTPPQFIFLTIGIFHPSSVIRHPSSVDIRFPIY